MVSRNFTGEAVFSKRGQKTNALHLRLQRRCFGFILQKLSVLLLWKFSVGLAAVRTQKLNSMWLLQFIPFLLMDYVALVQQHDMHA